MLFCSVVHLINCPGAVSVCEWGESLGTTSLALAGNSGGTYVVCNSDTG